MREFYKISFEQFKKDVGNIDDLYQNYNIPKRKTKLSAGYDFEALYDFEIKPGEIKKIPTGIKARMQDNEVLMLFVRSSMGFKYNIRLCNQVGIIDADFYNNLDNEGHIWVALQNEGKEVFKVKKGENFCQGVFVNYLTCGEEVNDERTGWTGKPEERGN